MSPWIKVFCVFTTADLLVWWVTWRALGKSPGGWKLARMFVHLFFVSMIAGIGLLMFGRAQHLNVDTGVPRLMAAAVFIWHLLMVPLAFAGIIVGTLWVVIRAALKMAARFFTHPETAVQSAGIPRREFFLKLCALAPPLLTVALSMVAERQLRGFRIRRITVTLPTLPPALDGMTIAHVADSHLGRFTHGDIIKHIADATNELRADLVLFAGDLINDSLEWLYDGISMLKMISGPLVVCEGNHDLFEDADEFRRQVKESGLNFLVNEATTLTIKGVPVQILGMQWATDSHRSTRGARIGEPELPDVAARLLKLRDPAVFPILLAHHPHAWDYVSDIPLTISGHTHGGQLMLNDHLGFGPMLFRYWSGLYTRKTSSGGSEALVVSNGTGNWFPLRTRAPAEIIHITLKQLSA